MHDLIVACYIHGMYQRIRLRGVATLYKVVGVMSELYVLFTWHSDIFGIFRCGISKSYGAIYFAARARFY